MSTQGIVVEGVARSFGAVNAVVNATFEARPGRITGLIGPNGAGKTTLMLMLASLLQPQQGTISLAGVSPVEDAESARPLLGWMPDGLGAWPTLTARETLVYTGRLYDLSRADAAQRAAELVSRVGLTEFADRPARSLSRGQKQRLGLARALVHMPSVLLLDEPASGLDPQARIDLRVLLQSFAAEGGTVLISSHVLSELDELVDDAVFMRAGSVVPRPLDADSTVAWRVRTLSPAASDPTRIAEALGWPLSAIVADRDSLILTLASANDAAAVLRQITTAGVDVIEYAPAVGRLERAFLALEDPR